MLQIRIELYWTRLGKFQALYQSFDLEIRKKLLVGESFQLTIQPQTERPFKIPHFTDYVKHLGETPSYLKIVSILLIFHYDYTICFQMSNKLIIEINSLFYQRT